MEWSRVFREEQGTTEHWNWNFGDKWNVIEASCALSGPSFALYCICSTAANKQIWPVKDKDSMLMCSDRTFQIHAALRHVFQMCEYSTV